MPADSASRQERVDAVFAACTRFVNRHYPRRPKAVLAGLAADLPEDLDADYYGSGDLIEEFEAEVAELLGKEAAVFMPSGTMAQQIALRIWADRSGNKNVGFHPTCHLEIHEQSAYRLLHGLHGQLVGDRYGLMTLDDLQAVRVPLGTLLLELPQREIGGALPAWDDLVAMVAWAREQHMITHMDGARLWESQPYYGRDYAAIAALFDTVYVSFYKILGGICGAMLLGPADVIGEARVWQRRHGGNLFHMYPFVLSARQGLHEHLPRMADYHAKAVEVVGILDGIDGITVTPNPPQTNMFHAFFTGDKDRLLDASLDIAAETGVWFLDSLRSTPAPGVWRSEFSLGNAALDLDAATVEAIFSDLMARATA